MKIEKFKELYYLKFATYDETGFYVFRTELMERGTNKLIRIWEDRKQKTNLDQFISDSRQFPSATPWTFARFEEEVKRFHFDFFIQYLGITNFFPLDKQTNPDTSEYYLA